MLAAFLFYCRDGEEAGNESVALYAIGDFHLSFQVHKPMDVFGAEWKDHVKKDSGKLEEDRRRRGHRRDYRRSFLGKKS